MILLTLGGIASALSLPVSLFPQIDYPRVVVSIDAGERDAAQMEARITRPMEIALRGVPGVTRIRSTTSRGSAEIQLNFSWGANMPQALLATEGALATIQPDLPTGTRYSAYRADPTVFPVYGLALTSEALDQEALRQIAELKVRPALTGITGVAEVNVLGGAPRTFEVDIAASNKNHVRRSASSIQTSSRLAVPTSLYSAQSACVRRISPASCLLSSRNSASISSGVTNSASLSSDLCRCDICPIERSVVPPVLRTRSAIGSVVAKIWAACSSSRR
jgi:hypothetical protein